LPLIIIPKVLFVPMLNKIYSSTVIALALFLAGCGMTAHKAYHIGHEKFKKAEYEHAIEYFKMALEKGITHPKADKVNYLIGESYRLSNRINESKPFYEKAVNAGTHQDSAYYYYAVALESEGKYGEAEAAFLHYAENGRNEQLMTKAKIEAANLKLIEPILAQPQEFKLANLKTINTDGSDWAPIVNREGDVIFSSTRGQSKVHLADGLGFNDIWKFKYDGVSDTTGVLTQLSKNFNLESTHEACPSISKNGREMYFARSNSGAVKDAKEVGIFVTTFKEGEWQEAVKLPFCEDTAWYSTPWLSPDNTTLYFSSNRAGGFGGLDLWKATKDQNGAWGNVTNLGEKINTHGNEYSVFISQDNKFYFGSDGHPGLGRLDLFVIAKDSATGDDKIVNLGLPFNSVSDDFGLFLMSDTSGYMTSDREGGLGNDDIYKIVFLQKKAVYTQPIVVYGYNPKTQREKVLKNAHVIVRNSKGVQIADTKTDENGQIFIKVDPTEHISIEAKKRKHFVGHEKAVIPPATPRTKLKEGLTEITFEKPVKVTLQEITDIPLRLELYYDYNKWDIRPDAGKILDSLVGFLKENPEIIVELSSHTDSRGNDKYNKDLSEKRAKSAVDYVVAHGIDHKKIYSKGYGETKPLVMPELSDADYQLNRRTEIRVVKVLEMQED